MADELTAFSWTVPSTGFVWTDAQLAATLRVRKSRVRVLTDSVPLATQTFVRKYYPLRRHRALFRTFALDVEPTELGVLGFANNYGALGGRVSVKILIPGGGLTNGEPIERWLNEIGSMKRLVNLWDAVTDLQSRAVDLSRWIHWEANGVRFSDGSIQEWIGHEKIQPDVLEHLRPGDLVAPAKWYVQRKINEQLEAHSVSGRLLWTAGLSRLSLCLVPRNLIGCLWLQFARSLDDRGYRRCEHCRLWFEIGPGAGRSDKKFCSTTCKAASHRKIVEGRGN